MALLDVECKQDLAEDLGDTKRIARFYVAKLKLRAELAKRSHLKNGWCIGPRR